MHTSPNTSQTLRLLIVAPSAAAGFLCLQVYQLSELCHTYNCAIEDVRHLTKEEAAELISQLKQVGPLYTAYTARMQRYSYAANSID